MGEIGFASIRLNGADSFLALFIFLLICVTAMFLALAYLVKSNQLTRLEIANKRLHKENLKLKKERDNYSDKFYIADFQLRMKSQELEELKEAQAGECEAETGDKAE